MMHQEEVRRIMGRTNVRCPELAEEFQQIAERVQQSGNKEALEAFQAYAKSIRKRPPTNHKNIKREMSQAVALDFWVRFMTIVCMAGSLAAIVCTYFMMMRH